MNTKDPVLPLIKPMSTAPTNSSLKYLSLFILVFQNACQVLLIRYSKTRDTKEDYLSTASVFFTEVVKLFACLIVVCCQEHSVRKCVSMCLDQIIKQPIDTLKVGVPALIYTIQNNLLYVAVGNLDAATFMVTYQLKILTTALFSVTMLRKPLSWTQWFSLVLLFAGVSLVQLDEQSKSAPGTVSTNVLSSTTNLPIALTSVYRLPMTFNKSFNTTQSAFIKSASLKSQSPFVGLAAVMVACMLSGFAGIYFEKILKTSNVSVWIRNIQLAVLALPISYVTMLAKDGKAVATHGVLYGFDALVWLIVFVYALGGLTVAVVIKYADNILKGFATSAAIVVSCVASVMLFAFEPSLRFLLGTTLVMAAIYVYSKYPFRAVSGHK